jgi:lysylphosphatidylglycerol synthetase-like protein (DUF2156 family)
MEFTIPTRAKKITLSLILIGVALAVIGVATGFDDHQFTTRLLTNGLINAFFFFAIALGALFFLALQYATETGWYASVKRVIEGIAGVLPYGMGFLALILLIITFLDGAHIYVWMDPETTNPASHHFDAIIEGKKPYLNKVFFWIRTIVYLVTYYVFWNGFRKRSLEEDRIGGTSLHFKNYRKGATFLVFFEVFS